MKNEYEKAENIIEKFVDFEIWIHSFFLWKVTIVAVHSLKYDETENNIEKSADFEIVTH